MKTKIMKTRKFLWKDTSDEAIKEFLAIAQDTQPFHQPPKRIMPGMFYVHMASQRTKRGIKSIEADFLGIRRYPLEGLIFIDYGKECAEYSFVSENQVLAKVKFCYDEHPELNDERLKALYSLSGKFIETKEIQLNENHAIYQGQTAYFNGHSLGPNVPLIGSQLNNESGQIEYPIIWKDTSMKDIGYGIAKIRMVKKNVFERCLKKVR